MNVVPTESSGTNNTENIVDSTLLTSDTPDIHKEIKPILNDTVKQFSITNIIEHILDSNKYSRGNNPDTVKSGRGVSNSRKKVDFNKLFRSVDNTCPLISKENSPVCRMEPPITNSKTSTGNPSSSQDILNPYKYCFIKQNLQTLSYNCHNCRFSTTNIKHAALHFINNQSDINVPMVFKYIPSSYTLSCGNCSYSTNSDVGALEHRNEHLFTTFLKCFVCNFVSKDDDVLKLHLFRHLNDKRHNECSTSKDHRFILQCFWCVKCNNRMESWKCLKKHFYRTHAQKRFVCVECKTLFYYTSDLNNHIFECHTMNGYKCLHCSILFKRRSNFEAHIIIHMQDLSSETSENKANILQALCKTQTNEISTKLEFVDGYSCQYCSFSTVLMTNLKDHLRIEHKYQRQCVVCNICSSSFLNKHYLKLHINTVHQGKKNP